jgi:hypothetical protein
MDTLPDGYILILSYIVFAEFPDVAV